MAIAVKVAGGKLGEVTKIKSIPSIGSESGVAGIHIAALPCPSITGEGMTRGWQILDIIGKATATLASYRAFKAAQMQNKIAREYYNLAKDEWDYFYNTFRPLEQAELAEIHATDPYKADYTTALEGHDCSDSVFENMTTHRNRLMGMFCVCPNLDSSINYDLALSTIRGDSKNFARRYAEKQAQKLDDLRWNRKIAAAGRGRGLLSQSADLARISADKFGQYSNAMTKFAGQAAEFSGYIRNRMETVYNGEHTNRINTRSGPYVDRHITGLEDLANLTQPEIPSSGYVSGLNYTPVDVQGSGYSELTEFYDPTGFGGHGSATYNGDFYA